MSFFLQTYRNWETNPFKVRFVQLKPHLCLELPTELVNLPTQCQPAGTHIPPMACELHFLVQPTPKCRNAGTVHENQARLRCLKINIAQNNNFLGKWPHAKEEPAPSSLSAAQGGFQPPQGIHLWDQSSLCGKAVLEVKGTLVAGHAVQQHFEHPAEDALLGLRHGHRLQREAKIPWGEKWTSCVPMCVWERAKSSEQKPFAWGNYLLAGAARQPHSKLTPRWEHLTHG